MVKRMSAGISPSYLSAIEHGKKHGSVAVMARIATAFDVLIGDLVPANMSESGEIAGQSLD